MSDSIFFLMAIGITVAYLLIVLFYHPKSSKR